MNLSCDRVSCVNWRPCWVGKDGTASINRLDKRNKVKNPRQIDRIA